MNSKKTTLKRTTKKQARNTAKTSTLKTSARSSVKANVSYGRGSEEVFGFSLDGWTRKLQPAAARDLRSKGRTFVYFSQENDAKRAFTAIKRALGPSFQKFQEDSIKTWIKKNPSDVLTLQTALGPTVIIRVLQAATSSRDPLVKSIFARARDAAGSVFSTMKSAQSDSVVVDFREANRDEVLGFISGLEIASYSFADVMGYRSSTPAFLPTLKGIANDPTLLKAHAIEASRLGVAVNLARHLTNLPGGTLTPTAYADVARSIFRGHDKVRVDVWDEGKLKAESMALLLAVGGAAEEPPRLVHIRYRPKERGAEKKPIALVGKGVTFDSGGLDIKPSSAMRLMKKDMGGSAAAIALAWWAAESELPLALDTYLALAENAVGGRSFRPGDIIKSRKGLAIEIHNTDAEGRLVLADAMDVAVSAQGDDAPACMIDLATLTGAIKVGLGGEIAGLFTTSDDLAREIYDAGVKRGDLSWRMPLFQPYKSMLRSNFADHVNASDGFAGAITAALFLELFAGDVPWAHLDIYAWRDSAGGAWLEPGGSGQGVLALTEVLGRFVSGKWAEG